MSPRREPPEVVTLEQLMGSGYLAQPSTPFQIVPAPERTHGARHSEADSGGAFEDLYHPRIQNNDFNNEEYRQPLTHRLQRADKVHGFLGWLGSAVTVMLI